MLKNTLKIFTNSVQVRSFSTFHPLLASRYYNAKIAITQKKNTVQSMDRLVKSEFQKRAREENKGPKSTPKNPVLYDTNKTRVFNRQFMENIGQALAGIPEFLGHGISITNVRHHISVCTGVRKYHSIISRSMSNLISLKFECSG